VRSAESLSPHRDFTLRYDWRLCRNKGLHPLRRFAAIPAHPQKQYTRLWRLYHFCGFYYPIREVIPIAIYHWNIGIVSRGKGKSAVAAAGISERTVQNAKRNMGGILGARRVGGQWYNFIKKKQPPEPAS
jgi:hypothetical protein